MPGPRLNEVERQTLEALWVLGHTQQDIATALGRHPATIGRELTRNGSHRHGFKHGQRPAGVPLAKAGHGACPRSCASGYQARMAQEKATARARRPRASKLGFGPNPHGGGWAPPWGVGTATVLRQVVLSKLAVRWSPAQISGWLKTQFPADPELHVSPETIYAAIYVQSRGNLRAELTDQVALRSGRKRRRSTPTPGGAVRSGRPWATDFNIATRPPEADDRAVPGHWEGDLVIGKGAKSAIITLVERSTRYVMLGHLPLNRGTEAVIAVLSELAQRLPGHLLRSLTWDNGNEMAAHATFTVATGCPVFFADPHHPWQRGSNENTNGLLRQYYPKGVTDFRSLDQAALDVTAHELNDRPRQTLGWQSPRQELEKLLVATAS